MKTFDKKYVLDVLNKRAIDALRLNPTVMKTFDVDLATRLVADAQNYRVPIFVNEATALTPYLREAVAIAVRREIDRRETEIFGALTELAPYVNCCSIAGAVLSGLSNALWDTNEELADEYSLASCEGYRDEFLQGDGRS